MASFDPAIDFVLANEGSALLNDPLTGEYSRYGITLSTASALKLCAADDHPFIDQLTEDSAKSFYLDHFWHPMLLTSIRVQQVANKWLDMGVNMGPRVAARVAQKACNALGAGLIVDGITGYKTIMAVNILDGNQLMLELRAESLQFYRNLVSQSPAKYQEYWAAWKERAEK